MSAMLFTSERMEKKLHSPHHVYSMLLSRQSESGQRVEEDHATGEQEYHWLIGEYK